MSDVKNVAADVEKTAKNVTKSIEKFLKDKRGKMSFIYILSGLVWGIMTICITDTGRNSKALVLSGLLFLLGNRSLAKILPSYLPHDLPFVQWYSLLSGTLLSWRIGCYCVSTVILVYRSDEHRT